MNAHYLKLGFALVPVYAKQKKPVGNDWQHHPITALKDLYRLEHKNVGLHHEQSKTIVLDIDNLNLSAQALASIGINLKTLLTAQGPKIISKNSVKPLYLLPDGLEPSIKQLK